jgi:hypothetical protein
MDIREDFTMTGQPTDVSGIGDAARPPVADRTSPAATLAWTAVLCAAGALVAATERPVREGQART